MKSLKNLSDDIKILAELFGVNMTKIIIASLFYVVTGLLGSMIVENIPNELWPLRILFEFSATVYVICVIAKYKISYKEKNKKKYRVPIIKWILSIIVFILSSWGIIYTISTTIGLPEWFPGESHQAPPVITPIPPTPTIDIDQIVDCYGDYEIKPCWFNTTAKLNSPVPIAGEVYSDESNAWRIAELMRDEDGIISKTPNRVLIPEKDRTIENLLINLNVILGHNFTICNPDPEFNQFPCLLETPDREYYQTIAGKYYEKFLENEVVKRLKQANDFEYFIDTQGIGDLKELKSPFAEGTIIYLPTPK